MRTSITAVAWSILACSGLAPGESSDPGLRVRKIDDSLVDAEALTIRGGFGSCINGMSFQQDAVTSHAGWQYVGYYDGALRVCLARRKLPQGTWEVIRFPDYDFRSNDAHNVISLGICAKDGTIHLAFDHHGGPLHYRRSGAGLADRPLEGKWESSRFGSIVSELEAGKPLRSVTYPRFWRTPDGGLQFCYRVGGSGNGDRMLADWSPERGMWQATRQIDSRKGEFKDGFDSSRSRCSYPNGYTYDGRGRLHVSWVWREQTQGANHDILYAYSDDRGWTWRNGAGQVVGDGKTPGKAISLDSAGILAVPLGRDRCLMNTQAQAVDSQGGMHVVMWHATPETLTHACQPSQGCWGPPDARRYHHYRREPGGKWQHVELPGIAGNRPKLFFDKQDNALLIFRSHQTPRQGPGVFSATGNLVLWSATAAAGWADWKSIHTEKGPFVNEMLADPHRWQEEHVLSVLVQESPRKDHQPTPLRILSYRLDSGR